jgi:hypothetical protein
MGHPSRTVGCGLEVKSADSVSNLIWTSLKFRRPYGTRLQTLKPLRFFCHAGLSGVGPACLSGNYDTGIRSFPGRERGVCGEGRSTSSHVLDCRTWGSCIVSRMRSWLVLFSLVPGLRTRRRTFLSTLNSCRRFVHRLRLRRREPQLPPKECFFLTDNIAISLGFACIGHISRPRFTWSRRSQLIVAQIHKVK